MNEAAVNSILEQIDRLTQDERRSLERQLEERELAEARREAARRGLNQEAIDEAVRRVRYGQ